MSIVFGEHHEQPWQTSQLLSREIFCPNLSLQLIVAISQDNMYCQTSDISGTSVGYEIVDHSDVAGASPVGAAPTTSSFST